MSHAGHGLSSTRRTSTRAAFNGTSSRVKVAVRCRPPFQDEIDFAASDNASSMDGMGGGEFFSIVQCSAEDPSRAEQRRSSSSAGLGRVSLATLTGKQRDFYFDYVFEERATQDTVYDRLARPVVNEVLAGCNGTIFAYGQTGTGKTYTMGILENVQNEHAGLIPRAASQLFDYVTTSEATGRVEITVSLSFLQLYRETIQDLLSTPQTNSPQPNGSSNGLASDENLAIREDPVRGFYVEGLKEFVVSTYSEAEALINLGLQNRAIAPTLMNSTSSRSHTVLTINIIQRIAGGEEGISRTLRSKLLMVDLAGSERVRRTISKGTRLSEAKSINSSLSALGNVIAALAEQNTTHIPYRDSKLTRLLQDSLGGTARTSLIATIGPAAINYSETLSTLLFAQRCMAVKVTPVKHEEVDYAEMCARLQTEINEQEARTTMRLVEQREQYELIIRELRESLETERVAKQQSELVNAMQLSSCNTNFNDELQLMLSHLESIRHAIRTGENPPDMAIPLETIENTWLGKSLDWEMSDEDQATFPQGQLVAVLAYAFEVIRSLSNEVHNLLEVNRQREASTREELAADFKGALSAEQQREAEISAMHQNDPRYKAGLEANGVKIGSYLTPMSQLDAMTRVHGLYPSNNAPVTTLDRVNTNPVSLEADYLLPSIHQYQNLEEIVASFTSLHSVATQNLESLNAILARKDIHFKAVKTDLTAQVMESRRREEEVVNWSYILKYLLVLTSNLRAELRSERRAHGKSGQEGIVAVAMRTANAVGAKDGNAIPMIDHILDEDDGEASVTSIDPPPPPPTTTSHASSNSLVSSKSNIRVNMGVRASVPQTNDHPIIAAAMAQSNSIPTVVNVPTSQSSYDSRRSPNRLRLSSTNTISSLPPPPVDKVISRSNSSSPRASAMPQRYHATEYDDFDDDDFDQLGSVAGDSMLDLDSSFVQQRRPSATRGGGGHTVASSRNNNTVIPNRGGTTPTRMRSSSIGGGSVSNASISTIATTRSNKTSRSRRDNPSSNGPSEFAVSVVKNLGVPPEEAAAVMSVIDRVSSISPEQLARLDEQTRSQILQIRRDLGIDHLFANGNNPLTNTSVQQNNIQQNAQSAPPQSAPIPRQTSGGSVISHSSSQSRNTTPRAVRVSAAGSPGYDPASPRSRSHHGNASNNSAVYPTAQHVGLATRVDPHSRQRSVSPHRNLKSSMSSGNMSQNPPLRTATYPITSLPSQVPHRIAGGEYGAYSTENY